VEGSKLERELTYQKETARRAREALAPVSHQVIERYSRCREWRYFEKEMVFHFIHEYAAARDRISICEFGCGDGINTCQVARVVSNADVCGLDISPELIGVAEDKVMANGVADRVKFIVGDVENDVLGADRFDIVLALNILHHVDIRKTVPKLMKAAKPGGMVVILEPIAYSETLQRLRDKAPVSKDVSPDERQLNEADVAYLLGAVSQPMVHYFNLFGRLSRLFPNRHTIDQGHSLTKVALKALRLVDLALFAVIPYSQRLSGRVVIVGYKPGPGHH